MFTEKRFFTHWHLVLMALTAVAYGLSLLPEPFGSTFLLLSGLAAAMWLLVGIYIMHLKEKLGVALFVVMVLFYVGLITALYVGQNAGWF